MEFLSQTVTHYRTYIRLSVLEVGFKSLSCFQYYEYSRNYKPSLYHFASQWRNYRFRSSRSTGTSRFSFRQNRGLVPFPSRRGPADPMRMRWLRFPQSLLLALTLVLLDAILVRDRGSPGAAAGRHHAHAVFFLAILGAWCALPQAALPAAGLQHGTLAPPVCVHNVTHATLLIELS